MMANGAQKKAANMTILATAGKTIAVRVGMERKSVPATFPTNAFMAHGTK